MTSTTTLEPDSTQARAADRVARDEPAGKYKIPLLIGIVGHRDLVPEQVPQIRAAIEQVLRRLSSAYPDVRPVLLTSMAEGADLLGSEVALALGISIICVLPFSAAECRQDLQSETSRALFDRVYAVAEHLEIAKIKREATYSEEEQRELQFQRAGGVIARYSTVLLAVWDGQDNGHKAGTARTIEYRRRGLMPVGDDEVLQGNALLSAHDNDLLYEIRCSRLSHPHPGGVEDLGFSGSDVTSAAELPESLRLILERNAQFNRDVDEFYPRIERDGRRLALPSPYPTPHHLAYLDRLFQAADWLSGLNHHWFTRTIRARYILWALMAFLLVSFKKESVGTFGTVAILGVLIVFALGFVLARLAHHGSWHRKYLDYRALAEGLRVDFYWEVAGVHRQFGGEFAHESFLQRQDAELEWIRTAMRAVSLRLEARRGIDIPHGFAHAFAGWVGDDDPVNGSGQLQYYRNRIHRIERRLELVEGVGRSLLLFGLALASTFGIEMSLRSFGFDFLPAQLRTVMLWAIALLPVYAAIFDTYVSETADRALVRQYRYMYSLFRVAARELRAVKSEEQKIEILRSLGHACLAEHAQWILGHRDKRIEGLRW